MSWLSVALKLATRLPQIMSAFSALQVDYNELRTELHGNPQAQVVQDDLDLLRKLLQVK
jgi:hypothetical protein